MGVSPHNVFDCRSDYLFLLKKLEKMLTLDDGNSLEPAILPMSATENSSGAPRRPLRVLMVEDSPPDAVLLTRALERGGFEAICARVDSREAMESALVSEQWDLVLADHAMPNFSAPEALRLVKNQGLDLPFIIVSGQIEEQTAVEAMRAGAHDYVMKNQLARLVPAVERELREAEVRRARSEYEEQLRRAQEELETRVQNRTADLNAAYLKLRNLIEERKRLENELLEIAENERRRIGFDLHDDLGQKLTGVSLMVKALVHRLSAGHHPCAADAARVHELVNEIVSHTHNLAHHFGSLDMKGDDLSCVLSVLAENVKKMFGIPCRLEMEGEISELSSYTMTQLYKIAQEAVSNAIKHGKARHVSISVSQNGGQLTLTIKNDGVAFSPPADAKDRMGLRIMNYRANTIGAALDIAPQRRGGTLVTCALPVKSGSLAGLHDVTQERKAASQRGIHQRVA
jgi:signal transduction histidine kinase